MKPYLVVISRNGKAKFKMFWTFKNAITSAIKLKHLYEEIEVVDRIKTKTIFKKTEGEEKWNL